MYIVCKVTLMAAACKSVFRSILLWGTTFFKTITSLEAVCSVVKVTVSLIVSNINIKFLKNVPWR